MKNRIYPVVFSAMAMVSLVGCDGDSHSESTRASPTKVNVYTSVDHCSTDIDVPNCQFENGVYVLK